MLSSLLRGGHPCPVLNPIPHLYLPSTASLTDSKALRIHFLSQLPCLPQASLFPVSPSLVPSVRFLRAGSEILCLKQTAQESGQVRAWLLSGHVSLLIFQLLEKTPVLKSLIKFLEVSSYILLHASLEIMTALKLIFA